MNLIRSLLFYLVFYAGTLVLLVLVPFQGRHGMRRVAGAWSGVHRWALRHILRIRVICEGAPRPIPRGNPPPRANASEGLPSQAISGVREEVL